MKALIFAAGIGSRLRPLTDHTPKALIEVEGKPLLQRVIERLRDEVGVRRLVVNVHHFPEQIREFLSDNRNFGIDIAVSDESSQLLDTGGGLLNAWSLLQADYEEPILLHNADILTDFPLDEFVAYHKSACNDVSLLVDRRKSSRMLYFNSAHRLQGWQNLNTGEHRPAGFDSATEGLSSLAFGGVHLVQPSVIAHLQKYSECHGSVFSTIPFYLDSIDKLNIRGFTPNRQFHWFDIGSPEKLQLARVAWHNISES